MSSCSAAARDDDDSRDWWPEAPFAEVVLRARRVFPAEPSWRREGSRLPTVLLVRASHPHLSLLSLDRRARTNAVALKFGMFRSAVECGSLHVLAH